MKKLLTFLTLALAAGGIITLSSCNKDKDGDTPEYFFKIDGQSVDITKAVFQHSGPQSTFIGFAIFYEIGGEAVHGAFSTIKANVGQTFDLKTSDLDWRIYWKTGSGVNDYVDFRSTEANATLSQGSVKVTGTVPTDANVDSDFTLEFKVTTTDGHSIEGRVRITKFQYYT